MMLARDGKGMVLVMGTPAELAAAARRADAFEFADLEASLGDLDPGDDLDDLTGTVGDAHSDVWICDSCGEHDPAGYHGPPELVGEAGAHFHRCDRWYCDPCARAWWARWAMRRMREPQRSALIREFRAGRSVRSTGAEVLTPPSETAGPEVGHPPGSSSNAWTRQVMWHLHGDRGEEVAAVTVQEGAGGWMAIGITTGRHDGEGRDRAVLEAVFGEHGHAVIASDTTFGEAVAASEAWLKRWEAGGSVDPCACEEVPCSP